MKKVFSIGVVLGGVLPFVASAAAGVTAFSILGTVARFLSYVIPVLVTIAVIYFIWQVVSYTLTGDDKKKAEAKKNIPTALIGLFLIVAFWGILSLITTTTGVGPQSLNEADIPCIPNSAAGIYCD